MQETGSTGRVAAINPEPRPLPSYTSVEPLRGIAPYIGGKRILASRIIEIIDRTPHEAYAEPFVGMGGVFFRRRRVPQAEIVNDLSADVATLFRILQRHYLAFVEMLRWQLTTRREFERLVKTDPCTLTDLERAARFFYLQKTAFGGKVAGRNFGVSPAEHAAFDVSRIVPLLESYHERLRGVVIERLPFDDFIRRYDRPVTLFYLDPPYWGSEGDYAQPFERSDFARLAELLRGIKGRFILSINDRPETRSAFAGFRHVKVPVRYSLPGGSKGKRDGELIVFGGAGKGNDFKAR